ncbi:MAG: DUF4367 domain-containing protein [Oscillospiraceae bacterium]|nr:DUF4367 domain-containing protein [Oscillospiraceae bacterium]
MHNKHKEQGQRARFARFMNAYAQMEGQHLLRENQTLQSDPASAVPEEADRRCMAALRTEQTKSNQTEKQARSQVVRPKHFRWGLAAAVVALLVALTTAAYASGLLGWIGQWNEDYFYFAQDAETDETETVIEQPEEPFETLEDALAFYDAPENIVPTYVPEGYEFEGFEYYVLESFASFDLHYTNGTNTILFSYTLYGTEPSRQYSKDEGAPEIYTINGIDHYILTNAGRYYAVWQRGRFECFAYGYDSHEELVKTITSIYEEETEK